MYSPDIAGKIAEPLTKIDKITIIGSGDSDGVGAVADHNACRYDEAV